MTPYFKSYIFFEKKIIQKTTYMYGVLIVFPASETMQSTQQSCSPELKSGRIQGYHYAAP